MPRTTFSLKLFWLMLVAAIAAIVGAGFGYYLYGELAFWCGREQTALPTYAKVGSVIGATVSFLAGMVVFVVGSRGLHRKISLPLPALITITVVVMGIALWQSFFVVDFAFQQR